MEVKGWSRAGPRKWCLGAAGPAPSGTAAHALHPNTSLSLAGGKSHSLVSCCMVCVSPTSSSCCHCAGEGTEAQQVPASGSLSKKLWRPRKHLPLSPCCPPGPLAHLGHTTPLPMLPSRTPRCTPGSHLHLSPCCPPASLIAHLGHTCTSRHAPCLSEPLTALCRGPAPHRDSLSAGGDLAMVRPQGRLSAFSPRGTAAQNLLWSRRKSAVHLNRISGLRNADWK